MLFYAFLQIYIAVSGCQFIQPILEQETLIAPVSYFTHHVKLILGVQNQANSVFRVSLLLTLRYIYHHFIDTILIRQIHREGFRCFV